MHSLNSEDAPKRRTGLTDAHAHLLEYGESVSAADLRGSISASDAARRVSQYIEDGKAPDVDAIITGLGWDQNDWTGAAYPTAEDLEIDGVKGRAVFLKRGALVPAHLFRSLIFRSGLSRWCAFLFIPLRRLHTDQTQHGYRKRSSSVSGRYRGTSMVARSCATSKVAQQGSSSTQRWITSVRYCFIAVSPCSPFA